MEFINLKAQYEPIESTIQARIPAVLEHGQYIMGPEVREVEKALAAMAGTKHCVSCASGTDALLMPLMAWGIGPGDAVFVPPFTFFATAEVVTMLGATPIFVDVDPVTYNMEPKALEKAIEAVKTQDAKLYPLPVQALESKLTPRAVIPVDLFGIPADYSTILPIAKAHALLVLEDAAQSFGAQLHGKMTCGMGCHAATTSFFPAKPLACYGDGGAIFTDDDALAALLQSIRIHGKGSDKYENVRVGINGRLDTLQAAILLEKLPIFTQEINARQKVAQRYDEQLTSIASIIPPSVPAGCLSVYAQYSILVDARVRDTLCAQLKHRGIPTNIYYPKPLHVQTVFAHMQYRADDMPVSTELSQRILSLPFHPYMDDSDIDTVCAALREILL